jgi:hypothetical protein
MSATTTAAGSATKPPAGATAVTAIVIPDSELDSGSELSDLEGFDSDDGLGGGGAGGKGAEDEEEDEDEEMWESESLLEDALEELTTDHFAPGVCARSRLNLL